MHGNSFTNRNGGTVGVRQRARVCESIPSPWFEWDGGCWAKLSSPIGYCHDPREPACQDPAIDLGQPREWRCVGWRPAPMEDRDA